MEILAKLCDIFRDGNTCKIMRHFQGGKYLQNYATFSGGVILAKLCNIFRDGNICKIATFSGMEILAKLKKNPISVPLKCVMNHSKVIVSNWMENSISQ